MSEQLVEYCFDEHSNICRHYLTDDSLVRGVQARADMSGVSKIAIIFDDDDATEYNSVDHSDYISFDADALVQLSLGGAGLPIGSYIAYYDVYYTGVTLPVKWLPKFRVRKMI